MGLYGKFVLPTLTELAMRNKAAQAERARFVPQATGVVLEIGVGSGLNIPIYGGGVRKLYALDPSAELLRMARPRTRRDAAGAPTRQPADLHRAWAFAGSGRRPLAESADALVA